MIDALWINRLSRKAINSISADSELCQASELKYIEPSNQPNGMIESVLGKGELSSKAQKVGFHLGGKRTREGQILLVKAEYILGDLVGRIGDSLWSHDSLHRFWPNQVSIPRIRNYLERRIEEEIREIIYLAVYLIWLGDQDESQLKRNVLLVPVNPWGKEVESYMRELDLEVRVFEEGSDSFMPRSWRIIKTLVFGSGSIIINILRTKKGQGNIFQKVDPCNNSRYKVSVPYRRSVDPEERNDLFWYKGSGLAPETIVVSFESSAYPLDKTGRECLYSQGFGGVVHDPAADLTGSLRVWKSSGREIGMEIYRLWFITKTLLFAWRNMELFWQWSRSVELMRRVNKLQVYYESERIRVDIGLDPVQTSVIRSIAMDNIGGVRIGFQWSSIEFLSSFLSKNDNIYFCWGTRESQFFSKARSCVDTLIISGYVYDRYIESKRPQAKKLREQLTVNGVQFVVTLFDTRVSDDYATVEDMEYFYQLFLNECLKDETFGLIIKSKGSSFLEKLENIRPIVNDANATGRCLVLEEEIEERRNLWHINNMFTFLPAMASDMAVSFSISTSGTESALAGARSVYYDHMNQPDHPYYENGGKGRLVFDDLKELLTAIRRYRAEELPDLGDHSPILDEIDPFRDGKAGERIGTYTRWLLDKLNAGWARNEAINWANGRYAEKWGADKVISMTNGK